MAGLPVLAELPHAIGRHRASKRYSVPRLPAAVVRTAIADATTVVITFQLNPALLQRGIDCMSLHDHQGAFANGSMSKQSNPRLIASARPTIGDTDDEVQRNTLALPARSHAIDHVFD